MKNKDKKSTSPEKEKTINVILAIVIALVLWAYVIGEVNPTTTQVINNVQVELLNMESLTERGLAAAGEGSFTVDVVVEGTRADLAAMNQKEIIAQADLFGWSEGENLIPVTAKVPDGIKLIEVRTGKINVRIEPLVAVSKPVEIAYTGVLAEGREVGAVSIKPQEIEISGARSDVASVNKIRVMVAVNQLSEEGAAVQAEALAVDKEGLPVENVNLSAESVDVSARICLLKEVTLAATFTGDPANGYGAETKVPGTIYVKGTKEALKNLDVVRTEAVDLTGAREDRTVALSVILPDDVELADRNRSLSAGITIVEVGTKTFTYSADQILIEGITKGTSVEMANESVVVMISANKENLSGINAEDFELYIDVANAVPGAQMTKILAKSPHALHSIKVQPSEIAIEVRKTQTE